MKSASSRKIATGRNDIFQEDGFTIVEMLIALSITALASTLMLALIVQLRPVQSITRANELDLELAATVAYLQNLISNSRRLALLVDDPDRKTVFVGQPFGIRFVSAAHTGSTRSVLGDVEISIRERNGGIDLIQQNTPRRVFADRQTEKFPIITGLKTVNFKYLSASRRNGLEWLDNWGNQEALPTAVKIKLVAERFDREVAIERIAIIRADQ